MIGGRAGSASWPGGAGRGKLSCELGLGRASSSTSERGLRFSWPRLVAPGLTASGAASAHGWAGEVGRSETEPARGEPSRSLSWRPQSGRCAPNTGARMPPGVAGWQVYTRPVPGLAMGGQIRSPLGTPFPGAAQTTHSPSPGCARLLGSRRGEAPGSHPNPHGIGAWERSGTSIKSGRLLVVCQPLGYISLLRQGFRHSWGQGLGHGP